MHDMYSSAMSFVDASNTINLKLFPTYPNPPVVHDYQVPVSTVDLKQMITPNWDLTVQKVTKHLDEYGS